MTSPEVDQELERLFSVTREATLPDTEACTRIRAGLDARLAAGAGASAGQATNRLWLGVSAAVIGVGIAGLWLTSSAWDPAQTAPAFSAPVVAPHDVKGQPVPAPSSRGGPAATGESLAPSKAAEVAKPAERSRPASSPAPSSSSRTAADSVEELTLVRAMQQALRSGDSSRALVLVAEHARLFPKGTLVEERESARAIASCQRADIEARASILATFTQQYGASPYAGRVKVACQ
jgi:hypothetical protein